MTILSSLCPEGKRTLGKEWPQTKEWPETKETEVRY